MKNTKRYREHTEENGGHREFNFNISQSRFDDKWNKEGFKFLGVIGSFPGNPCMKNEDQLNLSAQDLQNTDPSNIRNS
jgi:hypothetical protein